MLLGLDEVSVDRLFAQCLVRFEAMQTVYEDEAITIAPHQDGCLLSDFKYTLRDLLDGLGFERCAADLELIFGRRVVAAVSGIGDDTIER